MTKIQIYVKNQLDIEFNLALFPYFFQAKREELFLMSSEMKITSLSSVKNGKI